jgi:CheY-like chemotaxis protein
VGTGTTFSFAIPMARGTPQVASTPEVERAGDLEGLRVLVVDDNATNRVILQEILSAWGASPVTASGGREALEAAARARTDGAPFELILLDGHMPEMDGFGIAERVQQDPALAGPALMMLTSGGGQARDVERARRLGIRSYLVKPVKRGELRQAILGALDPSIRKAPVDPGNGSATAAATGSRVLVAEDTPENRMLVEAFLAASNHTLSMVDRGEAAVAAYTSAPDEFDLILMDIRMPGMDGYEATRRIRAFERERGRSPVPIVALTAHALDEERRKSEEAGCNGHLTKPIKKARLLKAVEEFARARR